MPGKRYSTKLIVAKLRAAERLHGQARASRRVQKLAISEQTFYRSHRG
jgi:hypothetical protein